QLLGYLDLDRAEEIARFVLHLPCPLPAPLAWALDQVSKALDFEAEEAALLDLMEKRSQQPAPVRCALARLAGRCPHPHGETWLPQSLDDGDPEVQREALRAWNERADARLDEETLARLLASSHPGVRGEAIRS